MFRPLRVSLVPEDDQVLWPKRAGGIFIYEVERCQWNKFTCIVFLLFHTAFTQCILVINRKILDILLKQCNISIFLFSGSAGMK